MSMSREEFLERWEARDRLRCPKVRIRQEHTHIDSFYAVTYEGVVCRIQFVGDKEGSMDVLAYIGGDGRYGNGVAVTAFLGSEVTSLGLSKHLKITVELIEES
jgi:hypothetical protein